MHREGSSVPGPFLPFTLLSSLLCVQHLPVQLSAGRSRGRR